MFRPQHLVLRASQACVSHRTRLQKGARGAAALAAAFLLLSAGASAQGLVDGFMRGAGKLDVALSGSYESYSKFWKGTTLVEEPNLGSINTTSIGLYAAYGITDFLDVAVAAPFVSTSPNAGYWSDQSGVQDVSAALKLRALEAPIPGIGRVDLLAAAGIALPSHDYINDAPVAIGHYSQNGDLRLLAHYTSNFGVFATLQGGYIRRGNVELDKGYETTVPDAVDVWGKIGYATEDLYAAAWIQRQNAQGGTDIAPQNTFPSNGISFTRVGLDVAKPLSSLVKGLGVSAGGAYTLDGRNIGQSYRVSLGAYYSLNLLGDTGATP